MCSCNGSISISIIIVFTNYRWLYIPFSTSLRHFVFISHSIKWYNFVRFPRDANMKKKPESFHTQDLHYCKKMHDNKIGIYGQLSTFDRFFRELNTKELRKEQKGKNHGSYLTSSYRTSCVSFCVFYITIIVMAKFCSVLYPFKETNWTCTNLFIDKKEIDDDDGYFVLCWCGGTQSSSLNMHTKYSYPNPLSHKKYTHSI